MTGMTRKQPAGRVETTLCADPASVRAVREATPGDRMVRELAETFAALSDPTLGLTGSAVSHRLRPLRGQRLDDDHIGNLMAECIRHVSVA